MIDTIPLQFIPISVTVRNSSRSQAIHHTPKLQGIYLTVVRAIFTFHTIWSQPVTGFPQCMQSHPHCATASSTFPSTQSQSAVTSFIPCSQPVTRFTQCSLGHSHNSVKIIHFFHTLPSQILNRHLSHTMQSQSPVSHTAVTDSYMFHTLQSQLLSWHLFYTQQSQSLVSHTAVTDSYMFHTLQSQLLNLHLLHTMRSQTVTQCSLCHLPPHLYHKAGTNYRCNGAVECRRTGHRQQSQ